MKSIVLPDDERVPVLGQGTWRMGEKKSEHTEEVAALRLGIEFGMTLIDTAEMYGEGGAEKVVADAIEGQRDRVFIVTKVYPHNASRTELPRACERSLKRLRIETIDLYLLHWREKTPPLEETVETFEKLRTAGKIKRWGVSNFDVDDMEELFAIGNGRNCAANQVLYNLQNREIEFDLLPFLNRQSTLSRASGASETEGKAARAAASERGQQATFNHQLILMAYSPVGHGRGLLENAMVRNVAKRRDATPAQVALAWVLRHQDPPSDGLAAAKVIAIPKASNEKHVRENACSIDIKLTRQDFAELDREFPPPKSKKALPML
ncbi:MAG: aldo/keto reductase [Candidatus Udaeobacter sp.]